jgi:lysophospholipase L1-like esterase
MLLPFALLAAVELGMRLAAGSRIKEGWQNRYVEFEEGTVFFSDWKTRVAMPKPAGTFRIFALGGSTTFGLGVKHAYPELVEEEVNARGGLHFEVINGGVPAAGSHRVFEVLKEAANFDPDLVLVYVGHNEFLEDVFFAPDSILGRQQRMKRFASRFLIVRWLSDACDLSGWAHRSFRKAPLQRHFFGNTNFPLIRTLEQYQARLAFLDSNLDLMVDYARAHHFRIVLMPEVANLMAPPGDSVHGPGFLQADRWSALMSEGQRCLARGDPAAAIAALQQAAVLDPDYAMTHFGIAQAMIATGDLGAARAELDRANALDRRGDRINGDIRETISAAALRSGIPLLDMQADLYGQRTDVHGPFGAKLFLDHCHPTEEGHRILARRILGFLSARGLIPGPAGQ